jgi:hypothetical protein
MNERIRELHNQARDFYLQDEYVNLSMKDLHRLVEEKFAELIVAECASIGDNYQDILGDEPECFNCRKVAYGIVDKIKQHFGVEE